MDIEKLKPLNDWLLVRMDPIDTVVGSIFIPSGTDHRKATVIAVGPGVELPNGTRQPVGVEVGERVIFNRAHGEHLQGKKLAALLGDDHLLIRQDDILLVFEGEVTVS